MSRRICFWLTLSLAFAGFSVSAQVNINSPYSHFGVGDLFNNRKAYNMSMGGMSYAFYTPYYINFSNPASCAGVDTTTFLFEGGLIGDYTAIRTESERTSSANLSLGYMLLAFPVTKWWKSSFGLTPYSSLGYSLEDRQYLENIGNTAFIYEGDGGLNQFYFCNSITLFKKLSLGMNVSYLFGSLDYDQIVNFPDSLFINSFKVRNHIHVEDFLFNFGLHYRQKIGQKMYLSTGLVYNPTTDLKAWRDLLATTFTPGGDEVEYVKDTISYVPDENGIVSYPYSFGAGLALENTDKWLAGVEFHWQKWEDYQTFGQSDSLKNSWRISAGGQFRPSTSAVANYWERLQYRFGASYERTYLKLRENQINEIGLTFGVGLPLRGSASTVNIAMEIGQGGTTKNGLIKENFAKFTVGISVFERWFIKRKFY